MEIAAVNWIHCIKEHWSLSELQRCFMNEREEIIRLWFDMWIKQTDLGIDDWCLPHAERCRKTS